MKKITYIYYTDVLFQRIEMLQGKLYRNVHICIYVLIQMSIFWKNKFRGILLRELNMIYALLYN